VTHQKLVRAVQWRMTQLEMTPYQLHVRLSGKVSKQTVYNFVKHGEVIKSDTLAAIMRVLDLTITQGESRPPRRERKASR
jgi:hypothetical protein